jgi:ribose transport system ATP-binding protein
MAALIEAKSISKRFGGTQALRDVNFSVEAGEVHALMGENGAGKSTLSRIIAGVTVPDAGEIRINGELIRIDSPQRARQLGIGIVFQELDLFPHLSVAENMALANPTAQESFLVRSDRLNEWCSDFLRRVKLPVSPRTLLQDLSIGQAQLVAIARALSMNARLIMMDEPTSSLADDSVESLFELIAELKEKGVSIVYISHKMAEVRRISDRITVLRDGALIGTRPARELSVDDLITMMVGRKLERRERPQRARAGEALLNVRNLNTRFLTGVNFQLQAGEVLGVAGLVGAGRSELGATLFGLRKITQGSIHLREKNFSPSGPQDAIAQGLCLVPEDRRWEGLFPHMTVQENATMAILGQFRSGGFVRQSRESQTVNAYRRDLAIAAPPDLQITALSGGNQQKVILARWLMAKPAVLYLDEPTRGIDVGAKEQIYGIIDELAAAGKGVIVTSSELPELFRCCDRILVLHEGRQAGVYAASKTTQEEILACATGLSSSRA